MLLRKTFVAALVLQMVTGTAAADLNPEGWKVRQSRMVLREATVTAGDALVPIEVYTEPERQGWGRQLAEWATVLVPAFYSRFGAPAGIDRILIVEEPDMSGAGWNGRGDGIRLRYPATVFDLARQLAHYWIHPGTAAAAWMVEGIAGWEALQALRAADMAWAADAYFRRQWSLAIEHWSERDFPLENVELRAQPPERYEFGRAKAIIFTALLNAHMGNRGYEDWLVALAAADKPQTSQDLAAALQKVGKAPQPLLEGWVAPGAYAAYRWSDLADADRDGIPNALEPLLGTSANDPDSDHDRLADGFEYWSRLNPADDDTVGDGRRDSERVGMAIDGLGDDWDSRSIRPAFRDAEGDAVGLDLAAALFAADAAALYLRLDTHKPVADTTAYWLTVHLDLDGDRRADLIAAGDKSGRTWYVRQRKGAAAPASSEEHLGLRLVHGRTIEMAIPLELLDGKRQIGVSVRVDLPGDGIAIDHWGGYWHRVDLGTIGVL